MSYKLLPISFAVLAPALVALPASAQFWRTLHEINGAANTLRNAAGAIDYTTDTLTDDDLERLQRQNYELRQQIQNQQLRNRLVEENEKYEQQVRGSNSPEEEKTEGSLGAAEPIVRQLAFNEASKLFDEGVRNLDTLVGLVPVQVQETLKIEGELPPAYRDPIVKGILDFWKQRPE